MENNLCTQVLQTGNDVPETPPSFIVLLGHSNCSRVTFRYKEDEFTVTNEQFFAKLKELFEIKEKI